MTFVLAAGGHNAGIVSEPGRPRRHFRAAMRAKGAPYLSPDAWLPGAAETAGSWWPAWADWLAARSSPGLVPPPPMGSPERGLPPLGEAPGTYVFER